MEVGWRILFTDYLDDVSSVYKDNASFTDPIAKALADRRVELGYPVAAAGGVRGGPKYNDAYMLLNVKMEYYLPTQFGTSKHRKSYAKKRKAYKNAGLKKSKRR
jgi:hypothetical protein